MLADKNDSFNLNMFWPFQEKMVSTVIKAFKPFENICLVSLGVSQPNTSGILISNARYIISYIYIVYIVICVCLYIT
jgi:hypothetical protein